MIDLPTLLMVFLLLLGTLSIWLYARTKRVGFVVWALILWASAWSVGTFA